MVYMDRGLQEFGFIINNQIGVRSAIGIDPNKGINFPFALKTGTWMTMEISQYIIADNEV